MKYTFLFIFLFISTFSLKAQRHYVEDGRIKIFGHALNNEGGSSGGNTDNGSADMMKRNAIKLNLSTLGSKTIELQYERALNTKLSVAVTGNYHPESTLPGTKNIAKYFSDTINIFTKITTSSWAVMPEFRLYFKQSMKGMYLGAYGRIKSNTFNFPISYTDDNNKTQTITVKGDAMSFGGGLLLGTHFNIKNFISLDWYIAGGHYTNSKFKLTGSASGVTLSTNDQQDVKDFLNSAKTVVEFFVKNMTNEVTSNSVTIKGDMGGIGIRAGLNIGIRF